MKILAYSVLFLSINILTSTTISSANGDKVESQSEQQAMEVAEKAVAEAETAFKAAAEAYRHAGVLAILTDPKRAIQYLLKSIELDKTKPETWRMLKIAYKLLGDVTKANEAGTKAAELEKEQGEINQEKQ